MSISNSAGIALLLISSAAVAQRPLVYPIRSQSAAQQSLDNAGCYGWANRQTGVNMSREPQRPVRTMPLESRPAAPMTTYWRTYGRCMHDRGYVVR
jgi:hypothetical protein